MSNIIKKSKTIDYRNIISLENKSKNLLSTIDYNFPSLNRKDLSDLSNINDKNHQFKKLNTNRDWSLNLYNLDIEGSSPRKFGYFFNKEDFTNKNNDIEKSSPKCYNQYINKKSFNLINDDIEFSKPQCVKNTTDRHTNPLEPKYIIGNPEILPMTPPKFIRDAMEINDIKGCRPHKIGKDKNLFKEPILKDKIKDSWPKKPYVRNSKYEYLDYRDVTKKYLNCRNTNPLRPIYNWSYVDNTKSFGPIDGNYPLVYSKYLYKFPFNLTNRDIEGSNIGSKNRYKKFNGTNYSYNTRDINGAQGDTLIRGIVTKRQTNPVSPKYQYLGHSEIQKIENNPYKIEFTTIRQYNKDDQYKKFSFNINKNNTYNNFNNINIVKNENENHINLNKEKVLKDNKIDLNKNITNNENNKILEKNIKIIDNKIDNLLPSEFNTKQNDYENLKMTVEPLDKKENKKRSISTFSLDYNNYYSKLDDFINKRNMKKTQNQNIKPNDGSISKKSNEKRNIENDI